MGVMSDIIGAIGTKLREITIDGASLRVFTAADRGEDAIPDGINQFPCALVFPGQTLGYTLSNVVHEEHTFEVHVQLLGAAYGLGDRTANALPLIDDVMAKMRTELGLVISGQRLATICKFDRQSGLADIPWGEALYSGYDVVFRVAVNRTITISLD